MSDITKRLRTLEALRTSGTITDEEYRGRRETILDRLTRVDPNAGRVSAMVRAILLAALILAFIYVAFIASCALLFRVGAVSSSTMGGSESPYAAGVSSGQLNTDSVGTQVIIDSIQDPALPPSGDGAASSGKRFVAIGSPRRTPATSTSRR
jgi:hypothetical protein